MDLAKGLPSNLSVTAAASFNTLKGLQQTPKYGIQAALKARSIHWDPELQSCQTFFLFQFLHYLFRHAV